MLLIFHRLYFYRLMINRDNICWYCYFHETFYVCIIGIFWFSNFSSEISILDERNINSVKGEISILNRNANPVAINRENNRKSIGYQTQFAYDVSMYDYIYIYIYMYVYRMGYLYIYIYIYIHTYIYPIFYHRLYHYECIYARINIKYSLQ